MQGFDSLNWIIRALTMEREHFQSCLITSSRRRIFKNSAFNFARGFHYWKLYSESMRRNYFCRLTATFHKGPTVAVTSPTHHCLVFRSRPHEAVSFLFYNFEWWFQAFDERLKFTADVAMDESSHIRCGSPFHCTIAASMEEKALVQRKNEISFTPHKTSFPLEFFFLCIGNCTKENLNFNSRCQQIKTLRTPVLSNTIKVST